MTIDGSILHPPEALAETEHPRSSPVTRILSLVALVGLFTGTFLATRLAHRALTDAWVAPLQLSPDNERVLELRVRQTQEKADRARLIAELASIDEELQAADVGLQRLGTLVKGYKGALSWSSQTQGRELHDLDDQVRNLESQRQLLSDVLSDHERLLRRSEANRTAGFITDDQYEREAVTFQQLQVALRDSELQLGRAQAARTEATSRGQALSTALATNDDPEHHSLSQTSPDVLKFFDDEVRVELEISRLQADKRSALARRSAAQSAVADMDQLLHDLESRPLYRAMQRDTDIAFAPYEQLRHVGVGSDVLACTLALLNCRTVGTVAEIVPGEVVAQDPWGELARGQYIVLDVRDRTALFQRVLRVRTGAGVAARDTTAAPVAQYKTRE
jgi:hypothetical protein